MPKYFFHIRGPIGFTEDEDGIELPDIEAARNEATKAARDIVRDAVLSHQKVSDNTIEIVGEAGAILLVYPVKDVIQRI